MYGASICGDMEFCDRGVSCMSKSDFWMKHLMYLQGMPIKDVSWNLIIVGLVEFTKLRIG